MPQTLRVIVVPSYVQDLDESLEMIKRVTAVSPFMGCGLCFCKLFLCLSLMLISTWVVWSAVGMGVFTGVEVFVALQHRLDPALPNATACFLVHRGC